MGIFCYEKCQMHEREASVLVAPACILAYTHTLACKKLSYLNSWTKIQMSGWKVFGKGFKLSSCKKLAL